MNRKIGDDETMQAGRATRPVWCTPMLTEHVVADITKNNAGDGNDASDQTLAAS